MPNALKRNIRKIRKGKINSQAVMRLMRREMFEVFLFVADFHDLRCIEIAEAVVQVGVQRAVLGVVVELRYELGGESDDQR